MKGIYSGRQILAIKAKGVKITRSQTAAQAEKAIIRKYGSISPEGKYFHLGKGNWKKYSLESDQTRTGRLAPDLKTWREAPHKWDREGVDTKKNNNLKTNTAPELIRRFEIQRWEINPHASKENLTKNRTYQAYRWKQVAVINGTRKQAEAELSKYKPNNGIKYRLWTEEEDKKKARVFSVTSLKSSAKPSTRKSININSLQRARITVKQGYNFKAGFEWTNNNQDRYKITGISGTGNNKNIKYINVAIPSKTYVTNENDLTFDLRMQKRFRKNKAEMKEREEKSRKAELEQKKKEEAEYQKQLEGLEGFETTLSKMNKPRAIELFNGFIRTNGKIKTRKDMIRDLIKAGYIVGKDKKGKTQLVKDSSVYDNLTKTEYNFAEYLIKKWKIKPKLSLSALKGPAKLAGRTNKLQPKMKGKAVLKNIASPKPSKINPKNHVEHDNVEWDAFAQKLVVKKKPDKNLVRIPCKSERDAYIKGRELEDKGITNIKYKLLGGVWTVEYKRQTSKIKANHVYASFMRPLWIGFNPGVQYREIKVTDVHKDFRFNRKPHSVIVTCQPIPEEKIKALELTDLIKGKKLAREVKRIKSLNFLNDNMKESLISQVLAGKDKAVIDKYIEKGRQLAEKKQKKQKFSVSKLKQSGKLAGRQSKTQPRLKNITPKTKVIITKAPKITIDQHFTKGKKSGSYAPTRIVNTPLEAFKIYMKHKNKYDTGLMFEAGPGTLTTANEITQAARVDTPSVIYNAIVKKLNLDKYYAYLKYTDDPMKLKTSPLRTLALRENWNRGAVL